jgi:hypothetical protein
LSFPLAAGGRKTTLLQQGRLAGWNKSPKSLSQADRRPSAMKQYSTAKRSYYIINGISLYRMIAVPLLIYLALTHQFGIFKWLLALGFFTDAIDGYLARRYRVSSDWGQGSIL